MTPDESLAQAYPDELPWLAFLYVSEELTPDEIVDFEERLLTDQAAREAVAQAMQMTEGLWMANAMDSFVASPSLAAADSGTSPVRRIRSRWAVWMGSTLVAAGLAFCVGWWFAHHTATPPGPGTPVAQTQPPESTNLESDSALAIEGAELLLGIWTDSESLLAELESGPLVEYPTEDFSTRDMQDVEEESFAWMLAAVTADPEAEPPAAPAVMEN